MRDRKELKKTFLDAFLDHAASGPDAMMSDANDRGYRAVYELGLADAKAERESCWHCKDALLPEPRARCENCPEDGDCSDPECSEPGCAEEIDKAVSL
jgi:hypothetical protein